MTNRKLKVGIDTNCIISLFKPKEEIYPAMQIMRRMREEGQIELYVSLKAIDQVKKDDAALAYARSLPKLPNYLVGSWGEQVGTWGTVAGTWEDAKRNEELRKKLGQLVKKGANFRDKQILIDAICAGMDVLVTNDKKMHSAGPASRLKKELGFTVMSPQNFVQTYRK
ncbi:MAG: hypothetical protein KAT11_00200 [Phycisphaerae bacterium]|nr:hypothetical protein [Phycisphaerae bacterium]